MSGVKRFRGDLCVQPVECVLASDYDTLRTANQRLEGEVARLREALQGWLNLFPKQGVSGGPITIQKELTNSVLLSGDVSK